MERILFYQKTSWDSLGSYWSKFEFWMVKEKGIEASFVPM
jgi:hypothetical protein